MYSYRKYSKQKVSQGSKIISKIFIIFTALILLFLLLFAIDSLMNRGKIYPNVIALQHRIGGLTRNEAYQRLQPVVLEILSHPLIINYERRKISIVPQDTLGATIDLEGLINNAYSIGRRGSLLFKARERIYLTRNNYKLPNFLKLETNSFRSFYQQLQEEIERSPRNASLAVNKIIPARMGIVIEREQLIKNIEDSMIKSVQPNIPNNFDLPVLYQEYELSTEEVLADLGILEPISSYETSLRGKQENSLYNIEKAANELNGVILRSGEAFSFNKLIGPAEKEDGYRESTIIANGQFVIGYGGGVCQVSTTLYNAALLANLPITERYNHSIYGEATNYVPQGRDAAVFYGYKDLKFTNSLGHPIVIFGELKSDYLTVTIWGAEKPEQDIRIITEDLKTYDCDVIEIKREELTKTGVDSNVLQEGIPGYAVRVYRFIKDYNGERREFISEDRYNSVPQKVIVD